MCLRTVLCLSIINVLLNFNLQVNNAEVDPPPFCNSDSRCHQYIVFSEGLVICRSLIEKVSATFEKYKLPPFGALEYHFVSISFFSI